MRYNTIRKMDVSNGEGIGVSLFVQGCSKHCKGCFNPNTWSFEGGKPFTQKTLKTILTLLSKPYITRFSILGGEPLEEQNYVELANLIRSVHAVKPEIKIWIWTGKQIEELQKSENKNLKYILDHIDYLIDGPFIEEEKDLQLQWQGSRNQRVIKL